jgi:HEAT repeat protein
VRATAVWVAGEIGDAGALGALVQATKDADPEFREMAAWSIGNIRPESVPPALLKLLADRERDVRMAATWAVYTIKDPAALSAVKAAYDRETDADVRGRLIWALGGFSEASVAILDSLITSGDDATREAAVNQLAKRGDGGPWPWPRPQPRPFP